MISWNTAGPGGRYVVKPCFAPPATLPAHLRGEESLPQPGGLEVFDATFGRTCARRIVFRSSVCLTERGSVSKQVELTLPLRFLAEEVVNIRFCAFLPVAQTVSYRPNLAISWARNASESEVGMVSKWWLNQTSGGTRAYRRRISLLLSNDLERAKGFEPSTPTLARLCSTPELRPLLALSPGC